MDNKTPHRTGQNGTTHNPYHYLPDAKAPPAADEIRERVIQLTGLLARYNSIGTTGDFGDIGDEIQRRFDEVVAMTTQIEQAGSELHSLAWNTMGLAVPRPDPDLSYLEWLDDDELQPLLRRFIFNGGLPEVPADVGNPDNPSDLIASSDRMRRWFALGDLLRPDVREKLADYHAAEIVMLDAGFKAVGRSMPELIYLWKTHPWILDKTAHHVDGWRVAMTDSGDIGKRQTPSERLDALNAMLIDVKTRLEVKAAAQRLKPAPAIIDQPDAAPPVADIARQVKPKRPAGGRPAEYDPVADDALLRMLERSGFKLSNGKCDVKAFAANIGRSYPDVDAAIKRARSRQKPASR